MPVSAVADVGCDKASRSLEVLHRSDDNRKIYHLPYTVNGYSEPIRNHRFGHQLRILHLQIHA